MPQRSLTMTWSLAGESLNSQASSSSLRQSLLGQVPLAVAEDDRRLVARDHVLELRDHVLVHVALAVGQPERVVPFVKRVVEAELHPALAHRLGHLPHQVAFRPDLGRVPWPAPGLAGFGAGPQAEALVVLRGRHDVLGAGAGEDVGPLVGVEQFGAKLRGEILVIEVLAVIGLVELPPGVVGLLVMHLVPIPLGIFTYLAPRRHRIDAPVDEDAELGVEKPLRRRARVE